MDSQKEIHSFLFGGVFLLLVGEDVEVAQAAVAAALDDGVQNYQHKGHGKQVVVALVVLLELDGGELATLGLFDFGDNLGKTHTAVGGADIGATGR